MGEDGSPLSLGSEALSLSEIWLWAALSCSETSLLLFKEKEFCCAFQWSCQVGRQCTGTPCSLCTCCRSSNPTETVAVSF